MGRTAPPAMFTFLSPNEEPMSTKPIHCPSGERNGPFGMPNPMSGVGSS